MSQVQSGILPEHCRAAIWIEANVKGDVDALRAASKAFVDKLATFQAKFPEAHLGAVVADARDESQSGDDGALHGSSGRMDLGSTKGSAKGNTAGRGAPTKSDLGDFHVAVARELRFFHDPFASFDEFLGLIGNAGADNLFLFSPRPGHSTIVFSRHTLRRRFRTAGRCRSATEASDACGGRSQVRDRRRCIQP